MNSGLKESLIRNADIIRMVGVGVLTAAGMIYSADRLVSVEGGQLDQHALQDQKNRAKNVTGDAKVQPQATPSTVLQYHGLNGTFQPIDRPQVEATRH
jgi:hypothetical protein